jgi:hypothetical protein
MTNTKENGSVLAKPGWLFTILLVLEALLSVLELHRIPGIISLTKGIGAIFPVVTNFMLAPSISPNVAPYLALTILLMPIKVYLAYRILLRLSKADIRDLVTLPSSEASFARKLISLTFVITLNVGCGYYVLFAYGGEYFVSPDALRSAVAKYRLISGGGIWMWVSWSVFYLSLFASLIGMLSLFIVEWWRIKLKRL